jgi:hypothetical protein
MDLTCRHKNQTLLVEGPEITIRPVGTRPSSMRGRFTTDQLQTMIDLYKSGATAEQVAHTSGFSTRSIKRLLHQQAYAGKTRTDHDHSFLWYPIHTGYLRTDQYPTCPHLRLL